MPAMDQWAGELGTNAKTFRANVERAKATGIHESKLMVEVSGSHSVNCNEKLFIPHISKNRVVSWVFTVTSTSRFGPWCLLKHVFTLDPNLPEFSITNVSAIDRPIVSLPTSSQEWQNNLNAQSPEYKVTVQFVSECYGNFYQRLVFGFGNSPKIVRNLGVMVAPETSLVKQLECERPSTEDSEFNWLNKYELITYNGSVQKAGSQPSKLPPNMKSALEYGSFDYLDDVWTPENYRNRLHTLLFVEEYERRKQMTRLNLHSDNILSCTSTSQEHINKSYIELPINPDVLEDTNHLINRSSYAIVKLVPPRELLPPEEQERRNPKLYEVIVLALKKDSVILLTSNELHHLLQNIKSPLPASVCFRFVNTYKFMHSAIDNINLDCIFPKNPNGLSLEFDSYSHLFLNKPQATALNHILDPRTKPPLLIFGPFGTGKTRTLAEAVKELCKLHSGNPDENLRILICTHSNSAADHYILNYLHPFITSHQLGSELCTPLRICWEDRFIKTVSPTVLNYCLISPETGKFAIPKKQDLDKHRVVVTTLVTADVLIGIAGGGRYFSHIFIDEAAQAMEAETLIPLCLSSPSTRVVLAGDHLQLGAIVDSPVARRLSLDRSLLVRLYEYYPTTSNCKLLLLENYRAYQEIVDVPSKLFYEGTLVAHKTRPSDSEYPVQFHGVLGKEARAPDIPSYYNMAEAAEISERVEELVNKWSDDYDDDGSLEESICVLAPYTAQVREIRQLLRRKGLGQVRVEGVNNVQGLEFDAIFISTVHTTYSMTAESLDRHNMGFLSDPRLLNTAVTRAKYSLVFVGDPNALCGAGDCKACWRTILSKCNENDTFHYRLPFEKIIEFTRTSSQNTNDSEPGGAPRSLPSSVPSTPTKAPYSEPQTLPPPPPPFPSSVYQASAGQVPLLSTPTPAPIPMNPMNAVLHQGAFPRPGYVNPGIPSTMYPYRPTLQTIVDPRGQTRLVYSAPQLQFIPGQSGPMMRTVPVPLPGPTGPLYRPGQFIPPQFGGPGAFSGQALPGQVPMPGQVRYPGQPLPGFPGNSVMPNQSPWQTPRPGMSPGVQSLNLSAKPSGSPIDSPLSRSASNSPSVRGTNSVTGSTGELTINPDLQGSIPNSSAVSDQGTGSRPSSRDPLILNGILSPCEQSTEQIVQSIMYNIYYRKQVLAEEEQLLVKLTNQRPLPKEAIDHAMKQMQTLAIEKECNAQRAMLHEAIIKQLGVNCTEPWSTPGSRRSSFNFGQAMAQEMRQLSLDSDEEIKHFLKSQGSHEGKSESTPSDQYQDSDVEEWFQARREDPLVQEYIKAFEAYAESMYLDSTQSYQNITVENFRAGGQQPGPSNPSSRNNFSYLRSNVHQDYDDRGSIFDRLLTNEVALCTLEVISANSGVAKVLSSDVKAMVLQNNQIGELRDYKDDSSQDISIVSRADMNRAFHGDIVAVEVYDLASNTPVGRVVNIVKPVNSREWVCTVDAQDSNVMIPIDKNNPNIFVMQSREHRNLKGLSVFSIKDGEISCREFVPVDHASDCLFLVRVLEWGANYRLPLGIVRKCFKGISDLNSVIPVFCAEHGIRMTPPDEVVNEVKTLYPDTYSVPESEWLSRAYRYNNAFTIDCSDSLGTELDDAISIVREKGGTFLVGVHVSDVSYFVKKDSCIDKAAYAQGLSFYPEQHNGSAINMLPPRLSQNLCSLLPKQDRLAVSVVFRMDKDAQIIKPPDIHRSVVVSCCSLTFKECDDILAGKRTRNLPGNLKTDLTILDNLARKLALRQVRLGCISNAMDLIQKNHSKSANIVEQLMILANATVAQRLILSSRMKNLTPLRRQLPPKEQASEVVSTWCAENGVIPKGSLTLQRLPNDTPTSGGEFVKVELSNLGHISTAVNAQDIAQLTESLLKCDTTSTRLEAYSRFCGIQERSQYIVSSHSHGVQLKHFSLGQEFYTHFTSPLRRYFDLVVHRCLLALVYDKPLPYSLNELQDICLQCQFTSARANTFKRSCTSISLANSLRTSQQSLMSSIERVTADRLTVNCKPIDDCKPFNRNIKVHEMGPSKIDFDESKKELTATWSVDNIYISKQNVTHQQPTTTKNTKDTSKDNYHVNIPGASWVTFIDEVTRGTMKRIVRQWKKVNSSSLPVHNSLADKPSTKPSRDNSTCFTVGSKVGVVLGSEVRRGLLQPVVRGIQVSPTYISCVSHQHNPDQVFCPPVVSSTEFVYQDIQHYQRVMLPLVEAEAAVCTLKHDKGHVQLCGVSLAWRVALQSVHGSATLPKGICKAQSVPISAGDYLCLRSETPTTVQPSNSQSNTSPCFLLHARVSQLTEHSDCLVLFIKVTEPADSFSAEILQRHASKYTIEVIPQCSRFKYMIEAIKGLNRAPEIIQSIVAYHDLLSAPVNLDAEVLRYFPLDIDQEKAVKSALSSPFTVIYGQPGTGKTWTAVAITCHFIHNNWQAHTGQVMVCAPNNKALDVVARMLIQIPSVKILRVYSREDEQDPSIVIDECKPLALHLRVRQSENPHSNALLICFRDIDQIKQKLKDASTEQKESLIKKLASKKQKLTTILDSAEGHEFTQNSHHVILCTCAEAGNRRISKFTKISQCIVDESNMCLDAELLVPFVFAGQQCQHMVLIGDPMQLVPVVHSKTADRYGLNRSLFSALFDCHGVRRYECRLLRMQFRMHPSLRVCSSELFYKDSYKKVFDSPLITESTVSMEGLWPNSQDYRHVLCHVDGEESVSTNGNLDTERWNSREVDKVFAVVEYIKSFGFTASHICIISPYLKQRQKIKDALLDKTIEVISPRDAQGTEQQFVVVSTVRTTSDLEYPAKVGCLGDVNQMNVVLTRARLGLIIVGNRNYLSTIHMWRRLFAEYESHDCVLDGSSWP